MQHSMIFARCGIAVLSVDDDGRGAASARLPSVQADWLSNAHDDLLRSRDCRNAESSADLHSSRIPVLVRSLTPNRMGG